MHIAQPEIGRGAATPCRSFAHSTTARPRRVVAALALALAGVAPQAQATLIVDGFAGTLGVNIPSGGSNPSSIAAGNLNSAVLGGARGLVFERTSGAGAAAASIDAGGSGLLRVDSAPADTVTARLQWDGDTNANALDPFGLGAVDLTEGGLNTMFFIAQRANAPTSLLAAGTLTLIVHSAAGVASASIDSLAVAFDDAFVDLELPFAAFAGGVDFTQVGAIELWISGAKTPGLVLEIDTLGVRGPTTPVPAPATLTLAGLALAAAGVARRRPPRRPG